MKTQNFNFELLYGGINTRQYLAKYNHSPNDYSLSKEQIQKYMSDTSYNFPNGAHSSVAYVGIGFFILSVQDD